MTFRHLSASIICISETIKRIIIMKAIIKALLFAAPIMFFAACESTDPDNPNNQNNNHGGSKDNFEIHMIDALAEYEVAADKDTAFIHFVVSEGDKDGAWKAAADAEWCKVEPAEGTGFGNINVIVSPNEKATGRSANVVITAGKQTHTIKISQSLYGGAMPSESWFTKNYWDRTDREIAGLRGPVKSWYLDAYTTYRKYYFDQAGHLTKEEWHNLDRNESYTEWEHTYDAAGHRIKSVYDYGDGDGARIFTFEYNNTGKLVATDPYCWVDFEDGYVSGKSFPMAIWKDLSAMHYVDSSLVYYERYDISYVFDAEGNLTLTNKYYRAVEGDPVSTDVYYITYANGYPVSCAESKVAVTYDANGRPLTFSEKNGDKIYTFADYDRLLVVATMREPDAGGMVAEFWQENSYNSNADITIFKRAYFGPDQVYTNTYDKYFYDAHGNWIQRNETSEPAFQHGQFFTDTVKREIEYY